MPGITIHVEGLDALLAKLGRIQGLSALRPAMTRATAHVQARLAVYPPQAHKGLGGFKSDKQRRFFFAALRSGQIQVPYRRTGTLGRRWTSTVEQTPGDLIGTVGNNTIYGPYVMDPERQAWMHKGVWQTTQDVGDRETESVLDIFADAVEILLAT